MKKSIAVLTTFALLTSAVQFPVLAAEPESKAIPFDVPDTYEETVDFLNNYGNIYVQGEYICFCGDFTEFPGVVNSFSSENSTAEFEIMSEESYKVYGLADGWHHSVMVFQVKSAGTLDFTWTEDTSIMQNEPVGTYAQEVYHFTFSVDDQLQITETDIFAFTPDSFYEAQVFAQENGTVSIHNGYIVYCAECCRDGGYEVFLETMEPSLAYDVVSEAYLSLKYPEGWAPPGGGGNYFVQVLKPKGTRGFLKLTWTQKQDWDGGLSSEPIWKVFDVAPTTSDIQDITDLTDFCTGVRVIDNDTYENVPDVTLGLYPYCDCIDPEPILTWNTSEEPERYFDYVDRNLYPGDYYIGILSIPECYSIMENQSTWTLNGENEICIKLTADAEIETDLGDVNGDGKCTIVDAVALQKWLLGTGELPKWRAADMNGDKTINGFDLALLKAALLEKVVPAEINVNSLTEADILSLTDGEVTALYNMLEAGKLETITYSYPFPEGFDPNGSTFVAYRYRADDGNFLYASAETDAEAETFAQEFFVPENDSYTFHGCEKVYSDEKFWIYRSYYSNQNVTDKPYYVIIYNKNYYDMATGQLHFALNEENLLEFLSIRSLSYNLKSFYTETEEQLTLSFYSVGYAVAGDWGINDDIEIRKTSITVDKATGTFRKSTNETVKAVELTGTAWDYEVVS